MPRLVAPALLMGLIASMVIARDVPVASDPMPISRSAERPSASDAGVADADRGGSVFWRGKSPRICVTKGCEGRKPIYCLAQTRFQVPASAAKADPCERRMRVRDAQSPPPQRYRVAPPGSTVESAVADRGVMR